MKPHEPQGDKAKNALHTSSVICILQKKPYMQDSFAMNSGLLDLCARTFPIPFLERAGGESARRGSFSPASFIHNGPSSRRAKRIQQFCHLKNYSGTNSAERGREPCRTGARTVQNGGANRAERGANCAERGREPCSGHVREPCRTGARIAQNRGANRAERRREPCRTGGDESRTGAKRKFKHM